ncbi:MAG: hypothetical protein LUH14_01730 [Clostridiaceae bacterium]|nr:hypothetical protein [Clostridiaceae bacterium]
MKKLKRILAAAGLLILAAMYLMTIVSAVLATPETAKFFTASLVATLMVPVLIYVILLIYRLLGGNDTEQPKEEELEMETDKKRSNGSR